MARTPVSCAVRLQVVRGHAAVLLTAPGVCGSAAACAYAQDEAFEESQKYKEGKCVIEEAMMECVRRR